MIKGVVPIKRLLRPDLELGCLKRHCLSIFPHFSSVISALGAFGVEKRRSPLLPGKGKENYFPHPFFFVSMFLGAVMFRLRQLAFRYFALLPKDDFLRKSRFLKTVCYDFRSEMASNWERFHFPSMSCSMAYF